VRSGFLSRLAREPLLHFALIGVALFLAYGWRNDAAFGADPASVIEITPELSRRLASQFQTVWQREPTAQEREGLIQDYLREEVLYRDALALGLDRNDPVIRQRMRMKMEMLSDGIAETLTPDEAALAAWFAPRAREFASPPQLSFLQVELASADDAAAMRARLEAGADPATVSHGAFLTARLDAATAQDIDGEFGRGFYAAVAAAPLNDWSGPVKSGYGMHLVKLLARDDQGAPTLDAVHPQVLEAWRRDQAQLLRKQQFDSLAARYRIVRSDGPGR